MSSLATGTPTSRSLGDRLLGGVEKWGNRLPDPLILFTGLFLIVASAPLLFVLAVMAAGWVMSRGEIAAGGASGKTALLLVIYPVTEYFPLLFAVTAGSIVIAVVRIQLIKRQNAARARRETAARTEMSESNLSLIHI